MTDRFHINLNRMALFVVIGFAVVVTVRMDFIAMALTNIYLNGIIIGTTIFGIGLCFAHMFKLIPEYRWVRRFFGGHQLGGVATTELPPFILRSIAIILNRAGTSGLSPQTLTSLSDGIMSRFEDMRESIRYITNVLIFMGLLGTFWGLIGTVGGFADMLGVLDFADENVMAAMQAGVAKPLRGIGMAFSSSLFGLAGSLTVGFLGLQVQLAQTAILRELEENLSARTQIC